MARGASSPSSAVVEPWVCGGCGAPKKVMRGSPRRGAGAGAASGPAGSLQTQGLAALRQGMRLQPSWKRRVLMQGGPCRPPGGSSPAFCPPARSGGRFPRVFWQGAVQGGWLWHCLCTHAAVSPAWHQHRNAVWGASGSFGVLWGVLGCCRELWGAVGSCRELWRAAGCTQHPGVSQFPRSQPFLHKIKQTASPQTHRAPVPPCRFPSPKSRHLQQMLDLSPVPQQPSTSAVPACCGTGTGSNGTAPLVSVGPQAGSGGG